MADAIPGVEQRIYLGHGTKGWDLTPDVGDMSVGAVGSYEDYYSGGVNAVQRTPLKADFNIALNTFRYGAASKGMDSIAGSITEVPWLVAIIGNGNGGGDVIDSAATVVTGNIVKGGKVSVQGVEVTSPADGIIGASGELPFREGAFEAVTNATNNAEEVKLTADGSVTGFGTLDGNKEQVALLIVTSCVLPTGTGAAITANVTDGTNAGTDATMVALSSGCRVFEMNVNSSATGSVNLAVNFTGTGGSLDGYVALMEKVD